MQNEESSEFRKLILGFRVLRLRRVRSLRTPRVEVTAVAIVILTTGRRLPTLPLSTAGVFEANAETEQKSKRHHELQHISNRPPCGAQPCPPKDQLVRENKFDVNSIERRNLLNENR